MPICDKEDETFKHRFFMFLDYYFMERKIQRALLKIFELPDLILRSAVLGYLDLNHQHYLILNHLLPMFKFYICIYKARNNKKIDFEKKHIKDS